MNKHKSILSTATVGYDTAEELAGQGISLDVVPFIEVLYDQSDELVQLIKQLADDAQDVVFTSKHAVYSVANLLSEADTIDWRIYCIGGKTQQAISEVLPHAAIVATADDAQTLVDKMLGGTHRRVVFFCGDRRLDTLPDALKAASVQLEEVPVYRTINTPKTLEQQYDAILFFSPSGVESFFSVNTVNTETVLFAIGDTTAAALRKQTNNKIVVSSTPDKRQVLRTALDYIQNDK